MDEQDLAGALHNLLEQVAEFEIPMPQEGRWKPRAFEGLLDLLNELLRLLTQTCSSADSAGFVRSINALASVFEDAVDALCEHPNPVHAHDFVCNTHAVLDSILSRCMPLVPLSVSDAEQAVHIVRTLRRHLGRLANQLH